MLLLCFGLVLSACNSEDNAEAEAEEKENEEETETVEQEEESAFEELTKDEVKGIIQNNVEELMNRFIDTKQQNMDWYELDFSNDSSEEVLAAVDETNESLTDLATEQYKDKYTSYYLEAFYCDCDAYEILDPSMVIAGFDVLEQDEDSFQATSIVIGNHLYPGPGSTYYWTYKKENEKWKIDEVTAESADKQPLNLTTEDLKNLYGDSIEIVDEIELDGEKFIVTKEHDMDANYAYSVDTGAINYEISTEYQENSTNENNETEETGTEEVKTNEPTEKTEKLEALSNPTFIHKYEETELEGEFGGLVKSEFKVPQFGINVLDDFLYEEYVAKNEDMPNIEDVTPTEDSTKFIEQYVIGYRDVYQYGDYVSILMSEYLYEGGVNGTSAINSFHFDLDRDEMVHLEEVLADKNISYERLDELVKTKLRDEQYREKLFADYESNLTAPEEDYNTFYATDEHLVIIFNVYHIGPKSSGPIEVPIGWNEF